MDTPYFQVSFRPNLKLIPTVRRFTEEFYERMLDDREMSAKLGLATHELLENAVAYATDGETEIRVELADDDLIVRTWNRISPERLERLAQLFVEMNRSDPEEYYQAMMHRTAHRAEGSGLGLARIRAEADMAVSYEVTTGRVCVQARTNVKKEPKR